jgi:hypothetical protein
MDDPDSHNVDTDRGRTVNFLDLLVDDAVILGRARRAKRDGVLDELYVGVCRYVFYVEKIEDGVHPHQLERLRRGKRFLSVAAAVRQGSI